MKLLVRLIFGFILTAAVSQAQENATQNGPMLVGDNSRPECTAALEMANAAFRATSPVLIWPVPHPDKNIASIVLSRSARDISAGGGIWADDAVFEKMTVEGEIFYWQRTAQEHHHIAVVEAPFNANGSWYSLYLLDEEVSLEYFVQTYFSEAAANPEEALEGPFIEGPVLYRESWATPTILRDNASGQLWVLAQGQFYFSQPEWVVHSVEPQGFYAPCRVVFHPNGQSGLARMPSDVQQFAAYADEMLGTGANEGTLRPTQRIRNWVAHSWTTIADRPWALTEMPYNSREEIETALQAWAGGAPERSQQYRHLFDSLAPAQDALTDYLIDRFAIGPDDARNFSAYAIDYMLRSYFVVRSNANDHSGTPLLTPWPADLR